ncbi:hypothetical protein JL722_3409 [Aureococcus anophagefferens]|nr:hypothetical protein JL722_3409 [Aureococcus anophagefferens]
MALVVAPPPTLTAVAWQQSDDREATYDKLVAILSEAPSETCSLLSYEHDSEPEERLAAEAAEARALEAYAPCLVGALRDLRDAGAAHAARRRGAARALAAACRVAGARPGSRAAARASGERASRSTAPARPCATATARRSRPRSRSARAAAPAASRPTTRAAGAASRWRRCASAATGRSRPWPCGPWRPWAAAARRTPRPRPRAGRRRVRRRPGGADASAGASQTQPGDDSHWDVALLNRLGAPCAEARARRGRARAFAPVVARARRSRRPPPLDAAGASSRAMIAKPYKACFAGVPGVREAVLVLLDVASALAVVSAAAPLARRAAAFQRVLDRDVDGAALDAARALALAPRADDDDGLFDAYVRARYGAPEDLRALAIEARPARRVPRGRIVGARARRGPGLEPDLLAFWTAATRGRRADAASGALRLARSTPPSRTAPGSTRPCRASGSTSSRGSQRTRRARSSSRRARRHAPPGRGPRPAPAAAPPRASRRPSRTPRAPTAARGGLRLRARSSTARTSTRFARGPRGPRRGAAARRQRRRRRGPSRPRRRGDAGALRRGAPGLGDAARRAVAPTADAPAETLGWRARPSRLLAAAFGDDALAPVADAALRVVRGDLRLPAALTVALGAFRRRGRVAAGAGGPRRSPARRSPRAPSPAAKRPSPERPPPESPKRRKFVAPDKDRPHAGDCVVQSRSAAGPTTTKKKHDDEGRLRAARALESQHSESQSQDSEPQKRARALLRASRAPRPRPARRLGRQFDASSGRRPRTRKKNIQGITVVTSRVAGACGPRGGA